MQKRTKSLKIGKIEVGKGHPVFVVAEAGINHNGDMETAKKMIESAVECGANGIKFQTLLPEELFSENLNPEWFEMIKKWSFNKKQHLELFNHAKKNKIEFFSTPVGIKTAKLLKDIKINCIKIASGEMTNYQLVETVAKMHLPMIVSTGMSTLSEISKTVEVIRREGCEFALLHCNASYPSPVEDSNLQTIPYLEQMFGVPVGYSDHTVGSDVCVGAVSLGACIVEKHFTLDKEMDGPDHKLSADPQELTELVNKIRTIEKALGSIRKGPTKSEEKFKKLMRKSIAVSTNISAGTKIKKSMLALIRPGTGIPPIYINDLVGITLKKDVKKGSLLSWDMF